jgi:hypothetical protein
MGAAPNRVQLLSGRRRGARWSWPVEAQQSPAGYGTHHGLTVEVREGCRSISRRRSLNPGNRGKRLGGNLCRRSLDMTYKYSEESLCVSQLHEVQRMLHRGPEKIF